MKFNIAMKYKKILNGDYHFYSLNFDLVINFNNSGGINGIIVFNNFEKKPIDFNGLYCESEEGLKLSFIIDYGLFNQSKYSITAFYGKINFLDQEKISLSLSWLTTSYDNHQCSISRLHPFTYKGNIILYNYNLQTCETSPNLIKPYFHYFSKINFSVN